MKNQLIKTSFLLLPSCIVKSPKYTSPEKVMSLELGMSKAKVETTLELEPHDLKPRNDTSHVLFMFTFNRPQNLCV
jgi:hypothetical protein